MKKFRLSRYTLASLMTLALTSGRVLAQAAPAAPAADAMKPAADSAKSNMVNEATKDQKK